MTTVPIEFVNLFGGEMEGPISYLPSNRHQPLESDTYRNAAVAVVMYHEKEQIKSILTLRSNYNGHHSGQISFPGGKFDPDDRDLIQTARRECYEEIGIQCESGTYVGKLENLYIPVSGFLIEPHLFYHEKLPILSKNDREVAQIINFNLEDLMNPTIKSFQDLTHNQRIIKNTPVFTISGHQVWGATAIILEDLRRILNVLLKSESSKSK